MGGLLNGRLDPWGAILALRHRWLALRLGACEGPLDLLLELARAQKVDLAQLSIAALAEQFTAVLDAATARRRVPLARLADWLERRPQLGRTEFGRGAGEPAPDALPAADVTELLRACLKLLERPPQARVYRPSPPPLWRVPEALAHMRRLLAELPKGAALARLLPSIGEGPAAALQRRAALASTLMAGLELSREGALALEQREGFGDIRVTAVSKAPTDAAA